MSKRSKILERLHSFLGVDDSAELVSVTLAEIEFKEAKYENIKPMIKLQKKVYQATVVWDYGTFLAEFNGPKPIHYLIAEHQGRLIGFGGIRIEGTNAHISNMAILSGYQNQGIGTCLLEKLLAFATTHQCQTVTLEVKQSNSEAQKLYSRFGFTPKKVLEKYYNQKQDGLLMERLHTLRVLSDE